MINKKELLIFSHLRQNGRQTLTRMSKKTNIPISTIYDKLRLHEGNMIKKHTCLLDFHKLGFATSAHVLFKVDKNSKEEMKNYLINHVNVNSLRRVNNNFDFLVEVIFRQLGDLEEFLESLDDKFKIKSKQVFYEIEDLKREGFLAQPNVLEILGF